MLPRVSKSIWWGLWYFFLLYIHFPLYTFNVWYSFRHNCMQPDADVKFVWAVHWLMLCVLYISDFDRNRNIYSFIYVFISFWSWLRSFLNTRIGPEDLKYWFYSNWFYLVCIKIIDDIYWEIWILCLKVKKKMFRKSLECYMLILFPIWIIFSSIFFIITILNLNETSLDYTNQSLYTFSLI